MSEKPILISREEQIFLITLNRPGVLNALNRSMLTELSKTFKALDRDNQVRVVLITGEGKAFAAGADISEMKDFTAEEAKAFAQLGHDTFDLIQNSKKPVIAVLNGYALGGGLELALSCDILLASEGALLGVPELNLGIIQGFGGTQRLPRLIGKSLAKELIFTADPISAERAYEIGLVNRVFPQGNLLTEAIKIAHTIAQKGPIALSLAKKVIESGYDKELSKGCKLEVKAFAECFTTSDRKEGIESFIEKRPPVFKNK